MPDAVIHPTPQELTAFGLGKLSDRAAAAIAAHLESCPVCRQAVAGVSADSFLDQVRAAKQDGASFPPSSAGRPAISIVPCPDLPPELARHPKYLILRELGRGGMGVVYQARQTVMNRPVVIKVINRSLLDRPDSLERFRREIQAAAQLSHPNIVTAYDAEQAGELHMLVMEFVPGQSLAEILEKKGPLSVRYACHYMRQAALGLQHAYERGMAHRDIKPGNLMLTPKGQIKILDFGLAKVISERDKGKGLTSSDACMGTPEYIAPEQAQNAAKADIRADLYSLGCTLYYLLAGRPPFREDTWMNTVLAHIQKQPQPLMELRPDVLERLWRVVARLLAKEPAQRYQKPIEVVQALAPFVKPGSKPDAKAVSAPAADVSSPRQGTRIAADTGELKKILREVPGKTPPKDAPAKQEAASPFTDLTSTGDASRNIVRVSEAAKPYLRAWWKRPGVIAVAIIFSFALILAGLALSKVEEHLVNRKTDEHSTSNKNTRSDESHPSKASVVLEIDQPGAEVLIDEQGGPIAIPGNKWEFELNPGTHKLRISKDSFVEDDRTIELKPGPNQPIKIALKPKPKEVPDPSKKPSEDTSASAKPPKTQIPDDPPTGKNNNEGKNSRAKEGTGKQDDADTINKRGLALIQKGDVEGAIDEFRRAIKLKEDYHPAHCNLSSALTQKGDIEGAISEARRAIELKKDGKECPTAHSNLGDALYAKGDPEGAIAAYRQAIALKPDFAYAYHSLGAALGRQKKYAEAEAAIRKGIALKPNDADAYKNLGAALFNQKKYVEAEAALRKAIALKPEFAAAYHNLGMVLRGQGKRVEAEAAFQKAKELKPD